jgi:hypothetical protein
MNMPHGDRSCGKVSSIAVEVPASADALGWLAGWAGAIVAGGTTPGAAGASIAGAAPAGCSWAVALPTDRMTDATNAANKPLLDNSFFLVLTAVGRFLFSTAASNLVTAHSQQAGR